MKMDAMNETVALMIKFMKTIREDIFSDFAEGALKNIELIKKNIVEHWKRDWVESWTVQHMRSVVQDDDAKAKQHNYIRSSFGPVNVALVSVSCLCFVRFVLADARNHG